MVCGDAELDMIEATQHAPTHNAPEEMQPQSMKEKQKELKG